MKFEGVFWDIDGTLYDNSGELSDEESQLCPDAYVLSKRPDGEMKFWIPYDGLVQLVGELQSENQGIISNGVHIVQINKLILLGFYDLINPDLIFTSYFVSVGEGPQLLAQRCAAGERCRLSERVRARRDDKQRLYCERGTRRSP